MSLRSQNRPPSLYIHRCRKYEPMCPRGSHTLHKMLSKGTESWDAHRARHKRRPPPAVRALRIQQTTTHSTNHSMCLSHGMVERCRSRLFSCNQDPSRIVDRPSFSPDPEPGICPTPKSVLRASRKQTFHPAPCPPPRSPPVTRVLLSNQIHHPRYIVPTLALIPILLHATLSLP